MWCCYLFHNHFDTVEEYRGVDEFLLVNQGMATLRLPYQPTRTDPGYPIQLKTEQVAIGKYYFYCKYFFMCIGMYFYYFKILKSVNFKMLT